MIDHPSFLSLRMAYFFPHRQCSGLHVALSFLTLTAVFTGGGQELRFSYLTVYTINLTGHTWPKNDLSFSIFYHLNWWVQTKVV